MSDTQTRSTVSFGFSDVARDEKAGLVRGVFDRSARRYDLMNDLMSLGIHRAWKDMVITRANPQPGERLIDVAGGTGDLARSFLAKADRAGAESALEYMRHISMFLAGHHSAYYVARGGKGVADPGKCSGGR